MWAVISGFITRIFGLGVAEKILQWLAFRAFVLLVVVGVAPIVYHNCVLWAMRFSSSIMKRFIDANGGTGGLDTMILNLTGLAGYLGNCFQLPQCFNIIMTAFTVRLMFNMASLLRR